MVQRMGSITHRAVGNGYSYSVSGTDSDRLSVWGDVDVDQDGGSGTIEDENGEVRSIDVEWTGYGVLEATDEYGNSFELEAE